MIVLALTVLDIGCGWGGMALTLARDYGAIVTGITLSTEQLAQARLRAQAEGLAGRVQFELADYRTVRDRFDRVVSVGMFEHVGIMQYESFFARLRDCLAEDGVALLHSIGRSDGPGATNAWVEKYIFPGGYAPALSETLAVIERCGLWVTDIEILRLHYARTIAMWRRRFAANRDLIASLYDERFCRMFELYLAGSELSFRRQGTDELPDPADPKDRRRAAHARLHGRRHLFEKNGFSRLSLERIEPRSGSMGSALAWIHHRRIKSNSMTEVRADARACRIPRH